MIHPKMNAHHCPTYTVHNADQTAKPTCSAHAFTQNGRKTAERFGSAAHRCMFYLDEVDDSQHSADDTSGVILSETS